MHAEHHDQRADDGDDGEEQVFGAVVGQFGNVHQIVDDAAHNLPGLGAVKIRKGQFLQFGKDFLFMGNQYTINVCGHAHRIDLLFFNRELDCLVAIELKTGTFKQMYLGELNGYLRLLDDYVRKPHENPSIGIILCKDADRTYVEYMIQDYDKPMGVATYKTATDMPERLRNSLPDQETLLRLMENNTD
mgnify:CR=1 FL=1